MVSSRREFLRQGTALGGALLAGSSLSFENAQPGNNIVPDEDAPAGQLPYGGPNVVLIRFGGGVRRRETIDDAQRTYCPFVYHEMYERQGGLFFPQMQIDPTLGVATSHGEGTLHILTGKYDHYRDVENGFLKGRFEAKVPTLFEYFRAKYAVPSHQTLIINGEDRVDEEFYTFSNHHVFGVRYRSTVLSLFRFKTFLLRNQIDEGRFHGRELEEKTRQLEHMESLDYRTRNRARVAVPEIYDFWRKWRDHYGDTGLVNPRGDRLLTTLTLWAMREIKPRLVMINYQDPDYVHWGNRSFYFRAISVIDEGIREIWNAVAADEFYRGNTVFVVVPDCGRDSNPAMAVPYQHHFNSRASHEIFGLITDTRTRDRLPRAARPIDRLTQQADVAPTIGQIMDFPTGMVEGASLLDRA